MEVVTIDSEAYKALMRKIDKIAEFVVEKQGSEEQKAGEVWLDSHELAKMLNISTRTLQRLRKDRLINYTILRGRCLYKLSDVEQGLNERLITASPDSLKKFRKHYLLGNEIQQG